MHDDKKNKISYLNILKSYIAKNIIQSIIAAIYTLGALFFILYFIHIDFVPTLNIADVFYLLIIMSLFGLFFLFFFAFMLAAPAFVWLMYQKEVDKTLIDKKQQKLFFYYLLLGSIFLFISLLIGSYLPNVNNSLWFCLIIIYSLLLLIITYFHKVQWADYILLLIVGVSVSFIVAFPLLINFIILKDSLFVQTIKYDFMGWVMLFLSLVISIVINVIIIKKKINIFSKIVITIASLIFIALFIARDGSFISASVMHNLHLGNFTAKEIVIKSEECHLLARNHPKHVTLEKNNSCVLTNSLVLSKLGESLLLELNSTRLVLPKKYIIYYNWEKKK